MERLDDLTDLELEEMAQADSEIDQEFGIGYIPSRRLRESKLVQISKLARKHHMTYGHFVSTHSEEEIRCLLENLGE